LLLFGLFLRGLFFLLGKFGLFGILIFLLRLELERLAEHDDDVDAGRPGKMSH